MLYDDNNTIINIVHSPIQHDTTKHIEIDKHLIKKKLEWFNLYSIYENTRAVSRCSHKRLVKTSVPISSKQVGYDRYLWTSLIGSE